MPTILDKLDEMDKFLETYNLPKLSQEELDYLNRQITTSEIETVIKKTPDTQKPSTGRLHGRILPNILRTNSYSSQTIPKKPRRWKTPKPFL